MSGTGIIQVVFAVFANESAAVGALAGLKHWDEAHKEIELGSIAAIKKVDGKVETYIERDKDRGLLMSGVAGVVNHVLAPVTMAANLVGGVANTFFKESEELTPEEISRIGEEMDAGYVLMIVICSEGQGDATGKQLASMGGQVKIFDVPEEAIRAAAAALEEAAAAAGESETE
jgi:hypothetical protein